MPTPPMYTIKDEAWSSHQIIAKWLLALEPGLVGLDVGAATGVFGKIGTDAGLILDGIEPHIEWADLASPLYRSIFKFPVEKIADEKLTNYDFIILADVLEHMVDPGTTLIRLTRLQTDKCLFFFSVPNIANIWVRINLLFGRFDYQERGILDRTHLHFYTLKSFKIMLQETGLAIKEIKTTPIPLPQVNTIFRNTWFGKFIYSLLYGLTLCFPRIFGYQFVIKATKRLE